MKKDGERKKHIKGRGKSDFETLMLINQSENSEAFKLYNKISPYTTMNQISAAPYTKAKSP